MGTYLLTRLIRAVATVWVVATVAFGVVHLTPSDPAQMLLSEYGTPEEVEKLRALLGLNAPIHTQYIRFMSGLVRGDLGSSILYRQGNLDLIRERLPATLQLTLTSLFLAMVIATFLGLVSAVKAGTRVDLAGTVIAVLGQSIPNYWLALILVSVFAVRLGWLPTSGRGSLLHLILPSLSLAVYLLALFTRLIRASLLEELGEQYVVTARGKGLLEQHVLARHALRNALIPVVSVVGVYFGILMGGTVVIETVFVWPGIGSLVTEAALSRDYPLVQALAVVIGILVVATSLVVDLVYGVLDPRIRQA